MSSAICFNLNQSKILSSCNGLSPFLPEHGLSVLFLDSMPSDKMSDMDSHLRNSVRELIDLTSETTESVFFIYSTKNVPDLKDVDKLVSPGQILEDLRKQGSFKVYVAKFHLNLHLFMPLHGKIGGILFYHCPSVHLSICLSAQT